jgi:hypothetical protein
MVMESRWLEMFDWGVVNGYQDSEVEEGKMIREERAKE